MGTILMKHYYTVYDMTPYDSGKDYIQVGFGPRNMNNIVGEEAYQPTDSNYAPADKADDSSHIIPPWDDQYETNDPSPEPVVPVDPTPVEPDSRDLEICNATTPNYPNCSTCNTTSDSYPLCLTCNETSLDWPACFNGTCNATNPAYPNCTLPSDVIPVAPVTPGGSGNSPVSWDTKLKRFLSNNMM